MRFCYKCGNEIKEGYSFCDKCGTLVYQAIEKNGVNEGQNDTPADNTPYIQAVKQNCPRTGQDEYGANNRVPQPMQQVDKNIQPPVHNSFAKPNNAQEHQPNNIVQQTSKNSKFRTIVTIDVVIAVISIAVLLFVFVILPNIKGTQLKYTYTKFSEKINDTLQDNDSDVIIYDDLWEQTDDGVQYEDNDFTITMESEANDSGEDIEDIPDEDIEYQKISVFPVTGSRRAKDVAVSLGMIYTGETKEEVEDIIQELTSGEYDCVDNGEVVLEYNDEDDIIVARPQKTTTAKTAANTTPDDDDKKSEIVSNSDKNDIEKDDSKDNEDKSSGKESDSSDNQISSDKDADVCSSTNIAFGKVVVTGDKRYYWVYPQNSLSDSSLEGYRAKKDSTNQLVLRYSDGTQQVIVEDNGYDDIAVAGDYIYYETVSGSICKIKTDGSGKKTLTEGDMLDVSDDNKCIIIKDNDNNEISSLNPSTDKTTMLHSDATYVGCHKGKVYYTPTESDYNLARMGKITLACVNTDGSDKKTVYEAEPDMYDTTDGSGVQISDIYFGSEYVYFSYQKYSGSGNMSQGARIVKVKYNGTSSMIVANSDSYALSGAFLVRSDGTVDTYREQSDDTKAVNSKPVIKSGSIYGYNSGTDSVDEYVTESDYSDFTGGKTVSAGGNDEYSMGIDWCMYKDNKVCFMVYYSERDASKDLGWRYCYKLKKYALYEKDLSDNSVTELYKIEK